MGIQRRYYSSSSNPNHDSAPLMESYIHHRDPSQSQYSFVTSWNRPIDSSVGVMSRTNALLSGFRSLSSPSTLSSSSSSPSYYPPTYSYHEEHNPKQ